MDRIKQMLNLEDASNEISLEIITGIVICLFIYAAWTIIVLLYKKVTNSSDDTPVIFSGYINGTKPRVVLQNPNAEDSITLKRSINENGIEYTYSLWLWIDGDNWNTNIENSRWRHIFHKGPKTITKLSSVEQVPTESIEIMCPGLWLSPIDNTLRLYVNTYDTNKEFVDINNIPIKKWIHLTYTQSNFTTNIYINGRLKKTYTLHTLPRQNYYNLYLTQLDGFKGYLSKMQYFNYVIKPGHIYDLAKKGPNLTLEVDKTLDEQNPNSYLNANLPYLSNRWWVDDLTL